MMEVYLKEMFDSFQEQFSVGRGSNLLEVKGVSKHFIEELHKTLADLWGSSPWSLLRSSDLIGVKVGKAADWEPCTRKAFKCVRFFKNYANVAVGLDVLRSEKDAVGSNGKLTQAIPDGGLLRITFGPERDLFPSVRKMIRSLGVEIAGRYAYPAIEVIYPANPKVSIGRKFSSFRSPNWRELKWLIACLKAVIPVHPQLQLPESFETGICNHFEDLLQTVELQIPAAGELEGNDFSKEKSSVVVRVTYPPKVTFDAIPRLARSDEVSCTVATASRQCLICQKDLLAERAPRCSGCKAVIYCDTVCQKKDWKEKHKDECALYKEMMERFSELEFKEFSLPILVFERACKWLDQIGLHGKGMWRRLCPCYLSCPFGHLPLESLVGSWAHAAAWGLDHGKYPPDTPLVNMRHERKTSSNGSIASPTTRCKTNRLRSASHSRTPSLGGQVENIGYTDFTSFNGRKSKTHTSISASSTSTHTYSNGNRSEESLSNGSSAESSITGWPDYFQLRGLSFGSPVAAILTFPLTVYHIVANICSSTKNLLAKNKEVTIHYLGPTAELDWLPAFAEIGHLLNGCGALQGSLHMIMIGPEVPNSLSGEAITLGKKLRITYVQGLYQEEATALQPPHMVVALNAGLDRSETWAGELNVIKRRKVPAFFTDYAESCCLNARQVLNAIELPLTQALVPNPFRSPVRNQIPFMDLPWFSNGFLFGVNT